ncbi:MAG: thioredoxin-disulfide reductase [Planctomycetes bacterium]|nr:thioredoxin-disulfide reductase [Planctomycetota bacterium]MBL7188983.1 thioredoxin-disulfide reductase [Phycisphaerae bacterium]
MEQVVIAGTGPAGLTAAIYAARARLDPQVIEGITPGGQLIVSHEVENMPGFPEGISGLDLIKLFKRQAKRFGARFQSGIIRTVSKRDTAYVLTTDETTLETRTLIIATGAQARRLDVPSEPKFYGQGVSGCATCDGPFFRDRDVLVVGGGNTAIGDALFLTRFARTVTIVHRRDYLRAAPIEIEKARRHPKIRWMIPWIVAEIAGDKSITGAVLKNPDTGETRKVDCGGIFVAIGHDPQTEAFRDLVVCDEHGFIQVESGSTQTSAPGVFACGDVCDPVYKQAVVAAGLGCMAALDAQRYLEQQDT